MKTIKSGKNSKRAIDLQSNNPHGLCSRYTNWLHAHALNPFGSHKQFISQQSIDTDQHSRNMRGIELE